MAQHDTAMASRTSIARRHSLYARRLLPQQHTQAQTPAQLDMRHLQPHGDGRNRTNGLAADQQLRAPGRRASPTAAGDEVPKLAAAARNAMVRRQGAHTKQLI